MRKSLSKKDKDKSCSLNGSQSEESKESSGASKTEPTLSRSSSNAKSSPKIFHVSLGSKKRDSVSSPSPERAPPDRCVTSHFVPNFRRKYFSSYAMLVQVGRCQIPKIKKENPLGEDACYVSRDQRCLGVFDGVGQWFEAGVNPRLYAEALKAGTKLAYDKKQIKDPLEILDFAWHHAKETIGSSTACVVVLSSFLLTATNLGDSGFIIIRSGKVVFESKPQQVEWSTPYQIGTQSDMTPQTHGANYSFPLQGDDYIVMGTDGLFDNLSSTFIAKRLKLLTKDPTRLSIPQCDISPLGDTMKDITHATSLCQSLSIYVAQMAYHTSTDKDALTPWGIAAKKAGQTNFVGGKPDDITVIVARISLGRSSLEIQSGPLVKRSFHLNLHHHEL